ncbi:MAG: hypothetical protein LBQ48_02460, partial [Oscillospiraceae bacterium]|nr:hypothetical protein [Oscillospiraceae bacterium]
MRKCRKIFALLLPVLCFAASGAVWAAPYDGSSALSSGEIRYDETNRTLQGTVMFSFNPAEFYGTSVLARLTANSGEGEKAEYYYLRLNKRLSETELELTDSDGKAVTVATVFAVSQDSRGCTVKFLNIHSDDFTLEFSDGTTHFSDACKVNLRNKSLVITVSEAVSDRISVKIDGRVFENDYSVFGQPDEHLSLTESGEKAPESSWAESAGEVKSAADSLAANGESRALGTVSQPGAKKSGGFTVVLICIVLILSAVVVVLVMQHLKNKKVKINKPALNGGTPVDGPPRTEFGSPEIEPPVDWRHNKEK